jgi:hypothetical protein
MIPLFTSIPPKWNRPAMGRNFGPAWLKLCINSWKASGFRPISLNSPAEIEGFWMLPVEFQPVSRSRPLISDLLDVAKKSGSRIAGIVNADCMTIPFLPLATALENNLDDGVVIIERLNISQDDLRPTGQHCYGFDGFFFTVESLEKIEWSNDWKIGSVWWDYCFPLAFAAAGKKIRTLPSPGLIHLDHKKRWSRDEWRASMPNLINAIKESAELYELAKPHITAEDPTLLIDTAFQWLRTQAALYTSEHESADELVAMMLAGMAVKPQPLSVKQLARQFPIASMRAARRILLGRA